MVAGAEGEKGRTIAWGILIFYFTNDSSLLETRHNSRDPRCRAFNTLNVPTLIIYSFFPSKYMYMTFTRGCSYTWEFSRIFPVTLMRTIQSNFKFQRKKKHYRNLVSGKDNFFLNLRKGEIDTIIGIV